MSPIIAARPARARSARAGVALLAASALGMAAGALAYAIGSHSAAGLALPVLHGQMTWAPARQPEPSLPGLRALRGRAVVLALTGPHCSGCALMRQELTTVLARLPAADRPAVVVRAARGVGRAGAVVYLIDREGYERTGYLLPFVPSFIEGDLRTLAAERSG